MFRSAPRLALLAPLALSLPAAASSWEDATSTTIGTTAEWSNKVELADVDDDGDLDILFANGGNYSSAGTPEPLRVFANDGSAGFTEITSDVFGGATFLARAVKVRDVTGDGKADILVATTYQTQSRLYVADGAGGFTDRTADLPQAARSFGDVELGDVDGDGDLDAMLADWGAGNPLGNAGGQPRLWLNDGAGAFVDAADRMPTLLVGMSWDLELLDVDNDRDLDALIACKVCDGSTMLRNDGSGTFTDATAELPQFGNNYEFEAMDLDGDGFLDVVTINDGPSFTEHVFRGTGTGFANVTADWWPGLANPAADDNVVAYLDVDADGDADFIVGSLDGADRVLVNDGSGNLSLGPQAFTGNTTPGTLGLAVGDLDGDGRLDIVEAQGEVASPDKVFLAVDLPVDTVAPSVIELAPAEFAAVGDDFDVVARIHDFHSPVRPTDFESVELTVTVDGTPTTVPMVWYGEYLFRATLQPEAAFTVEVCATDARGNKACSAAREVAYGLHGEDSGPAGADGGPGGGGGGGCGCRAAADDLPGLAGLVVAGLLLAPLRRRRGSPAR